MWFSVVAFAAPDAPASAPAPTEAVASAYDPAETSLQAEIGGSATAGNTEFYTAATNVIGAYKAGDNKIGLVATALIGRGRVDANGDGALTSAERRAPLARTAQRISGDLRYDRFFGQRNSLYALVGALHDPFAGFDVRAHGQIGYAHLFVKSETTLVRAELGADYAREDYVAGVDPNHADIVAARLMFTVQHRFGAGTTVTETVEGLENVQTPSDVRVNNQLALTAALGRRLAVKVSNDLRFDNVPVTGFRPLDDTTTATLVITLR